MVKLRKAKCTYHFVDTGTFSSLTCGSITFGSCEDEGFPDTPPIPQRKSGKEQGVGVGGVGGP